MELTKTIKLKREIEITDLNGEKAMIDFNTGNYYLIKGVGNVIWDMLSNEITVKEIIDSLLKEYDISPEECEKQVIEFLEKLEKAVFI